MNEQSNTKSDVQSTAEDVGGRKLAHVCFVAPYAYSLFDSSTHYPFGGIEVQAHLLATGLANHSRYKVSFVVWDHGQPPTTAVSNVRLVSCPMKESWQLSEGHPVWRALNYLHESFNYWVDVPVYLIKRFEKRMAKGRSSALKKNGERRDDRTGGANPYEDTVTPSVSFAECSADGTQATKKGDARTFVANLHWHVIKASYFLYDHVYYPTIRLCRRIGRAAVNLIWDYVWLFERWRILGRPSLNIAKRVTIVSRFKTYEDIDADIYIGFGVSDFTAELTAFCKVARKPIIVFVASDSDLSKDYYRGSRIRNCYGDIGDNCHFAVQSADRIVVQTFRQKQLAQERFRRSSAVIPNPIDLAIQPNPHRGREARRYVAWVGKADKIKQPDIFVELAKRVPELQFRMVMNASTPEIEQLVVANMPENAERIEKISRDGIPGYFEEAIALVNTSRFEGFSNAFIEACRAGTPLLSLNVDSGEILTHHNCGRFAAGSFETLIEELRHICSDREVWRAHHEAALKYVETHHDRTVCIDQLIEQIELISAIKDQMPIAP